MKILLFFVFFSSYAAKYLGEVSFDTGTQFSSTEIGGISGLVHQGNNIFWALSDDRGTTNPSRYYKIQVTLEPLAINFLSVHTLKDGKYPFKPFFLDPEGITFLPNGNFLVSSEGFSPFIGPMLLEFSSQSVFYKKWPIPSKFQSNFGSLFQSQGIRHNRGFESLTSWKNKTWTASEAPLIQDETFLRILEYIKTPKKEYIYFLDDGAGLSDMEAINQNTLLMLERGRKRGEKSFARVYKVNLLKSNVVQKKPSLKKDLIIDFSFLKEKMDNYEAMAIGKGILLIASDNNFSKKQTTRFLIVRWKK